MKRPKLIDGTLLILALRRRDREMRRRKVYGPWATVHMPKPKGGEGRWQRR